MAEGFICPLCQELYGEEIPMRPGVYLERVGRRNYFVVQGGLVCTRNPLHHLSESDYRLFQQGRISRVRLLHELRDGRNGHITTALLKFFGRGKR
jgi:hypothetical protein